MIVMTRILGDTAKVVALLIGALSILGRNIFPSGKLVLMYPQEY